MTLLSPVPTSSLLASRGVMAALRQWGREVRVYLREARTPADFARLMQVRLSESAAGPVVCPQQVTRRVRFRSLGGAVTLRSHSSDVSVLNGLVASDGCGPAARLLPPTETVVDLGVNTGLAAKWMLAQWGPRRLLAIEPEPGKLLVLRENLDQPGTTVVPLAVGGETRTARLTTTTGAFGFTLYGDDLAGSAGGVDVQRRSASRRPR